MNYVLIQAEDRETKNKSMMAAIKKLAPILADEKGKIIMAVVTIMINSGLTLMAPIIISRIIDQAITVANYGLLLRLSGLLAIIYIGALLASYIQTKMMGSVGQRTLFKLRNLIFTKLQELPVAFFNQNKTGDLISRINNDTDSLNQFFSQALPQLLGNIFIVVGSGIFIIALNPLLGVATLLPAVFLLIITRVLTPWVKKQNATNLRAGGNMGAEIQESLNNFKVIVAFNRRDYFRENFQTANESNYKSALKAGMSNSVFMPIYSFVSQLAQMVVLIFGIYLIEQGKITTGLLVSFILYASKFYDPLRQLANIWSTVQIALASWDRIGALLAMKSNLIRLKKKIKRSEQKERLIFDKVTFGYDDDKPVLKNINLNLLPGKTYALVGPTGGGKTTTASLMARLYDPSKGRVYLDGKDIRAYKHDELTNKIGFILQEPFLFSGTIRENILYGNKEQMSDEELKKTLKNMGLTKIIDRFDNGLQTEVSTSGESISLGQKQLIAFVRAVLRKPDLLILDEATANIDTVTEKMLDEILDKLPEKTTLVIIAHRLNTIENADEIFFVNQGQVTAAGGMEAAMEMLLHDKRNS